MKTIVTILYALSLALLPSMELVAADYHAVIAVKNRSGVVYTINENFEGTGTAAGWTDTNTPDWDYTTSPAPLAGAQSWFSTAGTAQSIITIPDSNSYTAVIMYRAADTFPSAECTIFGFRTSALSAICLARIATGSGNLGIYANGSTAAALTADAMSPDTTYYIQLKWVDSGTCSVEFSTTNSFVGSGSKYTSKTGGTTTDCTRFIIQASTNGGLDDVIIDNVQVWVP